MQAPPPGVKQVMHEGYVNISCPTCFRGFLCAAMVFPPTKKGNTWDIYPHNLVKSQIIGTYNDAIL